MLETSGDVAPASVLDDVEASEVVAVGESGELGGSAGVLVSVSVGVGPGELSSVIEESADDARALVLRDVPPPVAASFEEVRTVDVVGGEPQTELVVLAVVTEACAAMVLTRSTATPKNASPIAAPSAAGL